MQIPVIGIIENMSGFICPNCGEEINILGTGAGQRIATELSVPFLGKIPLDPEICQEADNGIPFVIGHRKASSTKAFMKIVQKVERFLAHKREIQLQAYQEIA
jgi:ATP-binding protein involved in chromosome partitioning